MEKLKALNIFKSFSEKDTIKIASDLAKKLKGGEIILLNGPIGAGKTIFVKGLAKALGSKKLPVSSSFNLMRFYKGRLNILHYDFFRVSKEEIEELGLEFNGDKDVIVIEWPKAAKEFYSRFDFINVSIKLLKGDKRLIKIEYIERRKK